MVGARLERALDRLLRPARGRGDGRVDGAPAERRGAQQIGTAGMSPDLAAFLLGVANVICGLLIGLRVFIARPNQTNARLVALICLCAGCYFTLAQSDYSVWIPPAYQIDVGI